MHRCHAWVTLRTDGWHDNTMSMRHEACACDINNWARKSQTTEQEKQKRGATKRAHSENIDDNDGDNPQQIAVPFFVCEVALCSWSCLVVELFVVMQCGVGTKGPSPTRCPAHDKTWNSWNIRWTSIIHRFQINIPHNHSMMFETILRFKCNICTSDEHKINKLASPILHLKCEALSRHVNCSVLHSYCTKPACCDRPQTWQWNRTMLRKHQWKLNSIHIKHTNGLPEPRKFEHQIVKYEQNPWWSHLWAYLGTKIQNCWG